VTVNADSSSQSTLQLPRLEVRRVLGSGGMGVVHAAYDPLLEREVAVKVIRVTGAASGARARILREARAIARISHPNVVHVYSAEAIDDQVAIVMELVQGQTLRAWLAEKKRTWQEIVAVFVEAGRGLAAAHDAGLVHRDFKPDNVMVRSDGRVCVLDFGLARALEAQAADGSTVPLTPDTARTLSAETTVTLDASTPVDHASPPGAQSRVTATGALVGTPLYMAPEQHLGASTDARADQFAFCVALYRALFGRHPFDDTTYATLVKSVVAGEYRAPTAKAVPQPIVRAIRRGLGVAPDQRYATIKALLDAVESKAAGTRRHVWAGVGGVTAFAALLAGLAVSNRAAKHSIGRLIPPPSPKRLTASGDVTWTQVSPDGRWLLLRKGYDLRLVDLTGRSPDKLITNRTLTPCEPAWSSDSQVFSVEHESKTTLHTVDSSRPPRDIPLRGCTVFVGNDEIASHNRDAPEIQFFHLSSGLRRSCRFSGTTGWFDSLAAAPERNQFLVATYQEATAQQHLWIMTMNCEDTTHVASFPTPGVDALVHHGVRASWGTTPDEVLTVVHGYTPRRASIVSISLSGEGPPTPILTSPSIDNWSVTRDGTAYYAQGDVSRDVWLKKKSGELLRLTRGGEGRVLGSLTADGKGVLVVELTDTGRALRVLPLDGGEAVTISLHDDPALVPTMASMSSNGMIAIQGTRHGVPVVFLRDSDGRVYVPPEFGRMGTSMTSWVGDRLLLNTPGNRDFAVYEKGRLRPFNLLADASLGYALFPRGAPDGERVALSLNRRGEGDGLWVVDVQSQQETKLSAGLMPPAGWSADGAFVYAARRYEATKVLRIPAAGGGAPELWVELPELGWPQQLLATPNGDVVVAYNVDRADAYSVPLTPPDRTNRSGD
jgi:serine/threonine protein kinase